MMSAFFFMKSNRPLRASRMQWLNETLDPSHVVSTLYIACSFHLTKWNKIRILHRTHHWSKNGNNHEKPTP